jgi:hypothetical protein
MQAFKAGNRQRSLQNTAFPGKRETSVEILFNLELFDLNAR